MYCNTEWFNADSALVKIQIYSLCIVYIVTEVTYIHAKAAFLISLLFWITLHKTHNMEECEHDTGQKGGGLRPAKAKQGSCTYKRGSTLICLEL